MRAGKLGLEITYRNKCFVIKLAYNQHRLVRHECLIMIAGRVEREGGREKERERERGRERGRERKSNIQTLGGAYCSVRALRGTEIFSDK